MLRKRMGGINWREVPPILAIGGMRRSPMAKRAEASGSYGVGAASALTTGRMRPECLWLRLE